MQLFKELLPGQRAVIHASLSGTWSGKTDSFTKEQVEKISIKEMTEYWYEKHYPKYDYLPFIKQDIYTKFFLMKLSKLDRMVDEQ